MRRASSSRMDLGNCAIFPLCAPIFFCGGCRECPATGVGPGVAGGTASFHRGQYTAMIHISSREKMLIILAPGRCGPGRRRVVCAGPFRSPSRRRSARGEGTAKAGGRRSRGMGIMGGMGVVLGGERRRTGGHWVRAGTETHPPSPLIGARGAWEGGDLSLAGTQGGVRPALRSGGPCPGMVLPLWGGRAPRSARRRVSPNSGKGFGPLWGGRAPRSARVKWDLSQCRDAPARQSTPGLFS